MASPSRTEGVTQRLCGPSPNSAVAPDANRCVLAFQALHFLASRFAPVNRKTLAVTRHGSSRSDSYFDHGASYRPFRQPEGRIAASCAGRHIFRRHDQARPHENRRARPTPACTGRGPLLYCAPRFLARCARSAPVKLEPLAVTRHDHLGAIRASISSASIDRFRQPEERVSSCSAPRAALLTIKIKCGCTRTGVHGQLQLAPDANRCFTVLRGFSLSARGPRP